MTAYAASARHLFAEHTGCSASPSPALPSPSSPGDPPSLLTPTTLAAASVVAVGVGVGRESALAAARRHAAAAKLGANTAYHLRGIEHGQWCRVYGHPRLEATDMRVGDHFRVVSGHRRTLICGWGKVTFGDRCFVNAGTILFSVLEVTIGDDVALANEVYVLDSNSHGTEGRDPYDAPVRIGDGTWVGARAVILPGVTIGKRVVVGAGAVVSKDVPDDCVVAGNPGVVTRKLAYPDHCQRAWCDWFCACPEKPRWAPGDPVDTQR